MRDEDTKKEKLPIRNYLHDKARYAVASKTQVFEGVIVRESIEQDLEAERDVHFSNNSWQSSCCDRQMRHQQNTHGIISTLHPKMNDTEAWRVHFVSS